MLYILFGEDSYSRHQFLVNIKKELGDPQLVDTNTTLFSGSQLTPLQLGNAANTIPFLAPCRLVVMEGLLGRFEPQRQSREAPSAGLAHAFAEAILTAAPTTTLVLIDNKASVNNPLFKAVAPSAQVKSFPPLRGEKLRGWVRAEVAKRGGSIAPEATNSLASLVGDDLWALSNELDKLLLYSGRQPIAEHHIQQVVAPALETNIFHLVDAIFQRRSAEASRWLHELLSQGMAPAQLLVLLARQLRFLVLAQEWRARKVPEKDMQQRLGLPDFAFRRTMAQSREYPLPQLIHVYRLLLDTDLAIKTGRQDEEVALDVLIAQLGGKDKLLPSGGRR